jgi:serine/threonine-protein kinase HipA
MRRANVYNNGVFAGELIEDDKRHFSFIYDDGYFADEKQKAISLTLPKSQKVHYSESLFPFFFNMLSEGVNRKLQSRTLKLDKRDHFGFLLATASADTIGAITVIENSL